MCSVFFLIYAVCEVGAFQIQGQAELYHQLQSYQMQPELWAEGIQSEGIQSSVISTFTSVSLVVWGSTEASLPLGPTSPQSLSHWTKDAVLEDNFSVANFTFLTSFHFKTYGKATNLSF